MPPTDASPFVITSAEQLSQTAGANALDNLDLLGLAVAVEG